MHSGASIPTSSRSSCSSWATPCSESKFPIPRTDQSWAVTASSARKRRSYWSLCSLRWHGWLGPWLWFESCMDDQEMRLTQLNSKHQHQDSRQAGNPCALAGYWYVPLHQKETSQKTTFKHFRTCYYLCFTTRLTKRNSKTQSKAPSLGYVSSSGHSAETPSKLASLRHFQDSFSSCQLRG